jgi:hypothetical protein
VKRHPRILKEWGEPIGSDDDDDVYDLEDLGEFESTDLSSLWLGNTPSDESNRARSCSFTDVEGPPLKRRKLDLYPLHDLIPQVRYFTHLPYPANFVMQPHIRPSSQRSSSTPLDVPRYISKKLIAIPPHTLPFSPSHFARTAWLIPVRGSFPWEGSTSAVILDASFSMPVPPNPNTGDPIMWTHASLASFWSYLIHLQNSCCISAIGLSFHASDSTSPFTSSDPQSTSRNNTFSLMSGIGNQAGLESQITSEQGSIITPSPPFPVALSSVDHIKVYHEASNAMQVRGALFAWLYPPLSLEQKDANWSQSVRVLKGASLVLVDERSRGVLIA